ncbi:hypothetical protein CCHR01_14444 [Colletotrichum chrysophilum]|uniref:Uncharacterized protein n=1 Tax=Colletotrichum chrysophilum TaxID=1836956 RepID=A0AAD9A9L6_9PEZI|nr:hypothetical protein CCHR01_14444 [Colletotrichum chrysophilum]
MLSKVTREGTNPPIVKSAKTGQTRGWNWTNHRRNFEGHPGPLVAGRSLGMDVVPPNTPKHDISNQRGGTIIPSSCTYGVKYPYGSLAIVSPPVGEGFVLRRFPATMLSTDQKLHSEVEHETRHTKHTNEAKMQKQTASFLRAWRLRDGQGLEMGESSVDSHISPIASSSTIVTRLMMNPGLGPIGKCQHKSEATAPSSLRHISSPSAASAFLLLSAPLAAAARRGHITTDGIPRGVAPPNL